MIPLAAAVVVHDLVATRSVANIPEAARQLGNCRVPIDGRKSSIGHVFQRRGNEVAPLRVVIQLRCSVAQIAARFVSGLPE